MEELNKTEDLYSKHIRLKDKINNLYFEVKENMTTEDEMVTFINDFTDNLSKLFYIIDNTLSENIFVTNISDHVIHMLNTFYNADINADKGFMFYYYDKLLVEALFGKLNFNKIHIFSIAILRKDNNYFLEIYQSKRPGYKEDDKHFLVAEGDKYEKSKGNMGLREVYCILNTVYTKLNVEVESKLVEMKNNKQKGDPQ